MRYADLMRSTTYPRQAAVLLLQFMERISEQLGLNHDLTLWTKTYYGKALLSHRALDAAQQILTDVFAAAFELPIIKVRLFIGHWLELTLARTLPLWAMLRLRSGGLKLQRVSV